MSDTPAHAPAATVQWSSRFAFLMAAIGSAVGLGNLWRFPFQTGANGGAAFVFVYLACVILIAFPVLVAEISVGRHKGLSAVGSTRNLAIDAGKSPRWSIAGWAGMTAAFFILPTYSVIAGQVMAYSAMSFMGVFADGGATGDLPLLQNNTHTMLWQGGFMLATIWIVARGLTGGIEKVVTILMPMFFIMLAGLAVFSLIKGDAGAAVAYLFTPNFSALTPQVALSALGQAFFSIGVGGAVMITYGSYLSQKENIPNSSMIIAGADTGVALIAGLMIFPIVFAFSLDPAAGMSLIFETMPSVFAQIQPMGNVVGGVFFFLAFIAALTSSISLLQVVSAFTEEHTDISRGTTAMIFGGLAWFLGAGSVFSSEFGSFLDDFVGLIALPMGALLIAVFAGWVVPKPTMQGELPHAGPKFFGFWRFLIRYPVPIAVATIIITGLNSKFGLFAKVMGLINGGGS